MDYQARSRDYFNCPPSPLESSSRPPLLVTLSREYSLRAELLVVGLPWLVWFGPGESEVSAWNPGQGVKAPQLRAGDWLP